MSVWPTAFRLAARGIPTFPCRPNDKRPLTAHGLHDASAAFPQLQAWARQWPRANLGLPTGLASRLLVVDIDCKAGVPGVASLHAAEATLGKLPRELVSRTPSGGYHVWFRMPDADIRNSAGRLGTLEAPGVDIRAEGGYVLVAPSSIDGRAYEWLRRLSTPDLPQAWVDALQRKERPPVEPWSPRTEREQSRAETYVRKAVQLEVEELATAPRGTRNHRLWRSAAALGGLVHTGAIGRDDVRQALAHVCSLWGSKTPRRDRETVDRGLDFGVQNPRQLRLEEDEMRQAGGWK